MRYTSVFMLCVSLLVYAYGNNVSDAQQEIDKSKRWAIIIGISQYERNDDINPLQFAVNDATAIKEVLIDPLTGTFLADHVLLLTDSVMEKPTRANILDKLALLENLMKPEDTLLIFFSGHGYPKGQEVYLLPQDARLTVLQDTAIPLTVWNERIAQIPAQKKIIILDACHSGGVEKGKGGAGEMTSLFEQFITASFGQATLSSSKRGQTSYEDEVSGHGVFTRYLLDTLKGDGDADGNKVVTLKEASDYVDERVRAWAFQKGKVQMPHLEPSMIEDVILAFAGPQGMVLIPAGEFEMGSNDGESNEKPVHTVYLDAFYMDKYEVTNAQYARFLNDYGKNTDAAGHELLDIDSKYCPFATTDPYCLIEKVGNTYRSKSGYENHPVIVVTWYGAAAYAQFYGKRLPTEAEWEKAARGGLVGKKYPWGDEVPEGKASFGSDWSLDGMKRTLKPVGSFAPNGYGLYDMAGNVWEWCADEYDSGYYSNSPKNNPKGPGTLILFVNNDFTNVTQGRVSRGGSWPFPGSMRVATRGGFAPLYWNVDQGFRCCVSSASFLDRQ